MERRAFVLALGLAIAALAMPSAVAAPAVAKEATVTLQISGMT